MVDIALETGAVDNRDDPPQSGARVEGDGPTRAGDSTPLVSSMQTVGGGMVAFEFSSEGVIGDDMVLDDDRWRWRHTVSYWVCVCYILGSMLFVAGSAFWYKHYVHESRQRALVVYRLLLRIDTVHGGGLPGHVPGHQLGTARGEQAVGVVPGGRTVSSVPVLLRRCVGIQRVMR